MERWIKIGKHIATIVLFDQLQEEKNHRLSNLKAFESYYDNASNDIKKTNREIKRLKEEMEKEQRGVVFKLKNMGLIESDKGFEWATEKNVSNLISETQGKTEKLLFEAGYFVERSSLLLSHKDELDFEECNKIASDKQLSACLRELKHKELTLSRLRKQEYTKDDYDKINYVFRTDPRITHKLDNSSKSAKKLFRFGVLLLSVIGLVIAVVFIGSSEDSLFWKICKSIISLLVNIGINLLSNLIYDRLASKRTKGE